MSELLRQKRAAKRQTTALWTRLARSHAAGTLLPRHQHSTGQLLFATQGVMLVEAQSQRWTIPPQRALWIPPQHPHSIQILSATQMRTLYFQAELLAQCPGFERQHEVHAVVASALIRELVIALFDEHFEPHAQQLMAQLLLHTLRHTPSLASVLPMPCSELLLRAANKLLAGAQWHLSLTDMAAEACLSERSFSRKFSAEVGIGYRSWLQKARIIASLDGLAQDRSIKSIAGGLGFSGPAAYGSAFAAVMGCSPKAFRAATPSGV